MSHIRKFTVVGVTTARGMDKGHEHLGGEFKSKTAVGAAKKAASRICAAAKVRAQCSLIIRIKDLKTEKQYVYKVKRVKSDVTVNRDGVDIHFRHNIIAVSLNQFQDKFITPASPKSTPKPKSKSKSPKSKSPKSKSKK